MRSVSTRSAPLTRSLAARVAWTLSILVIPLFGGGCLTGDSFFDPSIVGRWEETPTVVPVLDSIAAIEDDSGTFVEYSEVSADDLVPQAQQYAISPGDQVELTIFDLFVPGQPQVLSRVVDPNGFVEIPQVGRVRLAGLSEEEATERLADRLRPIIQDPLVSVVVRSRRQQTYTLQGNVAAPGLYNIPSANFRLLEALITSGGVNEGSSREVFVIRQVALEEAVGDVPREPGTAEDDPSAPAQTPGGGEDGDQPSGSPDELIDIIEDLTDPDTSPGAMGSGAARGLAVQPADETRGQPETQREPAVDLVEPEGDNGGPGGADGATGEDTPATGDQPGRWVFLNGQWVRASRAGGGNGDGDGEASEGEQALVTQRVIRVPLKPLLAGDAQYNLVVRPGDVIRVPPPEIGNVYVAGQVARPGVYSLPAVGRLTLQRVITAAGGLSAIAIPERVDLTRMVGPSRQATIMLNLRAIAEGTQPDVFLKPDDRINVGTTFWALPLAVVRGGFRANYGFGFQLDRNFGNDVFGAPPTNVGTR